MGSVFSSQKTKLWLAAVLLVAAAGYLVFQFTRPGPLSNSMNLVCAATGQTFRLKRERVLVIPASNPETGEETLLPCYSKDGELYVMTRYRGALERLGERNRYVDIETLAVRNPR